MVNMKDHIGFTVPNGFGGELRKYIPAERVSEEGTDVYYPYVYLTDVQMSLLEERIVARIKKLLDAETRLL
jgi:hypothetical protein